MKFNYKTLCALLPFLACCNVEAQQKKQLTPEEYGLWHTLSTGVLSHTGKWVTYSMLYPNGRDTLFLENTVAGLKQHFPFGTDGKFSPSDEWFAHIQHDTVKLQNLHSGSKYAYDGFSRMGFLANGGYLYAYNPAAGNLLLVNLKNKGVAMQKNVQEFLPDDSGNRAAIITGKNSLPTVKWIDLKGSAKWQTISTTGNGNYSSLVWNASGESLAFQQQTGEIIASVPSFEVWLAKGFPNKITIKSLQPNHPNFPSGHYIPESGLYISKDGNSVFFDVAPIPQKTPETPDTKKSTVEIWHNKEKQLPPSPYDSVYFAQKNKWSAWLTNTNTVRVLETTDLPEVLLTGDDKHALLFNPDTYKPHYVYNGDYIDLYILDLATGEIKLVATKVANEYARTIVSPSGKYVAYFKEQHWWLYDIAKSISMNITQNVDVPWYNIEFDRPREKGPYGCAGFTLDDSHIFLYDQFDTWMFTPKGKGTRLTKGRETNTTWRLHQAGAGKAARNVKNDFTTRNWSLKTGFVLKGVSKDDLSETISHYSVKSGVHNVWHGEAQVDDVRYSNDWKTFVVTHHRFDSSPAMWLCEPSGKQKQLAQANKQQSKYNWGKSELISYTALGKSLKGVLVWPANYEAGKKYPMIVNIYERKAHLLHEYTPPSLSTDEGMNVTNFSHEGYFVLLPDIIYAPNDIAQSSLACVTAAVNVVLEKGVINPQGLGLVGHSFGGFETALMVSYTDMFSAAIAGSMISDPVGYYLTLDGWGDSNMWRFEEYQMRINKPYYSQEFQDHSPIMRAKFINTPLLIWMGDKDCNVPWWESMKLNNALWRLNKKHAYLIYRGDDHVLYNPENRKDIYLRSLHWFDVHLKGKPAQDWAK
ncbi:MAG: hypothetical protein EOO51_13245 [Flavobacterium sp.]|nr:MAG: hypothetical protein EOO51_13245 [Flavobacterium sp.]